MSEIKKAVIRVDIHDNSCKRKALKAVSSISGIDSLAMDMKYKKLTIVGDINPVDVIGKLKKWNPVMVTFGPAKEEKQNEQEKKGNEDDEKMKKMKKQDEEAALERWIEALEKRGLRQRYYADFHSMEEDPNACVII